MTASSPMSVQAKGQPAAIVAATTQTPKAIIPTEIRNESTVSMIGPLSSTPHGITGGLRDLKANERNEPELRSVRRTKGI
jgi:hypothetical protein